LILTELPLSGAFVIEPERLSDDRGHFARTFSAPEFRDRGLNPMVQQCSYSYSPARGTLRGLHYQAAPYAECKLVRCTRGAVYDVGVDLRPDSDTYRQWHAVELTAENRLAVYLPEGFAHGLLTLVDDTEVYYQMSSPHVADAACGVRWDDPALAIRWPAPPRIMSDRDRRFPDLQP
jgi:dTDP-4-dehydrorhamnose 3,5-epimerase